MKTENLFKINIFSPFLALKILLLLAGFSLNAQTIVVNGKVANTLQQPLAYANILAVPEADNLSISFAITIDKNLFSVWLSAV